MEKLSLERVLVRRRESWGFVCEMAPGAGVGPGLGGGTVGVRQSTCLARGGGRVRWLCRERTTDEQR